MAVALNAVVVTTAYGAIESVRRRSVNCIVTQGDVGHTTCCPLDHFVFGPRPRGTSEVVRQVTKESTMKVREAMTGNVRLTNPDRSIREAAQMMIDQDIGALPVGEDDRLVGMITDRDIAVRAVARGLGPDTKIREVMSADVLYCFEDEDLDDATQNMGDVKVRRLPVLNRDKRLVGILSISDLSRREDAEQIGKAIADISAPGGAHSQAH
jgi:CBS domain-containing protein